MCVKKVFKDLFGIRHKKMSAQPADGPTLSGVAIEHRHPLKQANHFMFAYPKVIYFNRTIEVSVSTLKSTVIRKSF